MIDIPATTIIRTNPYVGPRSFKTNEKLYGRDRELRQLIDRLMAERIVLLHSPSGAGKTSLVQAGLIPQMREEEFYIHAVIRVNLERTRDLPCSGNRYTFSTLLSLEEGYPEKERMEMDQLSCKSLDDYLSMRAKRDGRNGPELLIFDQFEEVLTIDPSDREGKQAFFAQLGTALKNRDRWALFVMREDYVAALEPYVRAVPTYFANTFRLDLLGVAAAREAVQKPARDAGVNFSNEAANKLIDDLRSIQVMGPEGGMESALGLYVEPVQLQVVCYRLWETLGKDDHAVTLSNIAAIGDVDQSLSDYYALSVGNVAKQAGVSERAIREWFENRLVTKEGIRGQVLMGASSSEGLENRAVRQLENAHIIRAEKRAGATWYELAHDRLIQPMQKNNHAWFDANLNLLQRQAALWEQQSRSEGLLIRGKDLGEAEKQAATIRLMPVEQEFLEACRKLRKAEQRERLRTRIIMGLGAIAGIAFIIAMVLAILAINNQKKAESAYIAAEQQRQIAEQQRKAAQDAEQSANEQKIIAQLSAVEAIHQQQVADTQRKEAEAQRQIALAQQSAAQASLLNLDNGRSAIKSGLLSVEAARRLPGIEAEQSLRRFLDKVGMPVTQFKTNGAVVSIQFTGDGKLVAVASEDSAVRVWDVTTGKEQYRVMFGSSVTSLKYNQSTGRMAAGSDDKTAIIWDAPTGENQVKVSNDNTVNAIDIRPDGKQLVTGSDDGTAKLWDAKTGALLKTWKASSGVLSLAFNPDGLRVVASDRNGQVAVLNTETMIPIFTIQHKDCDYVDHLVFSPDGNLIAGACSNYAIAWASVDGAEVAKKEYTYNVTSVQFSQDSKQVLSGGEDFIADVWEVNSGRVVSKMTHSNIVNAVTFASIADQPLAVSSSSDGTSRVWNVGTGQEISRMIFDSVVEDSAFSPDGQYIASGTQDGTVILWRINAARRDSIPLFGPNDYINFVAFGTDGQQALVVSGKDAEIFDTGTGRTLRTINLPVFPTSTAASQDLKKVAVGGDDHMLHVIDLDKGTEITQMTYADKVTSITFSSDGKYVLAGGDDADKTARVWDAATGKEISRITFKTRVNTVAFSPNGNWAAAAGDDDFVYVWETATGKSIASLEHKNGVRSISFSPNGDRLASGGYDGQANVFDLKTGKIITTVKHEQDKLVRKVSFSPDGQWILTAGTDGSARVWDASQGTEISQMVHDNVVEFAVFSPNGQYVASGSQDRTVWVWEAKTGKEIARISHLDWVTALAFSPDNKHVLSGSFAGATYWSTQVDDLVNEACRRLLRNFKPNEWKTYFSGEPFRESCAQLGMGAGAQIQQPEPNGQVNITTSTCSINSNQEAQITFQNHTGKTLDAYWIDYSCKPQYYFTLNAGEEYMQSTYVSHPWVFVEKGTGNVVFQYVTAAGDSVVEVK